MAGNRFGTWKKRTAAVFMAVCLLGAMPGAVWAADTADGLESSISDSETKKQELEQKNAELSQALEEAKQNAEDQEALHQAYQDKIDVLDQQIEEAYAQVSQLDEEINDLQSQISNREGSIEKNTELLKDIPHVRFLDMAVVFYLLLDRNEKGRMTALIHNNHLECWKITGDELYQIAKVNTPKLFPAKIQTLGQVLLEICKVQFGDSLNPDMIEELSEEEDTASSFYVLSNGDGVKGAGCILYEGCLRKLAEQQHSDLIILPSSIHEVLLVCDRGEMNYQELNEMVKCINKENVPMEDVLSDRIYRYSCADDKISLIDTL